MLERRQKLAFTIQSAGGGLAAAAAAAAVGPPMPFALPAWQRHSGACGRRPEELGGLSRGLSKPSGIRIIASGLRLIEKN